MQQNLAVRGIVIDDEHADVLQVSPRPFDDEGSPGRLFFHWQDEPEGRALAGLAFQSDLAAHQVHQLFGNRQTESRASIAPRQGTVRLGEGLKEFLLRFVGNADAGVGDRAA